jgi:hypothetical protein
MQTLHSKSSIPLSPHLQVASKWNHNGERINCTFESWHPTPWARILAYMLTRPKFSILWNKDGKGSLVFKSTKLILKCSSRHHCSRSSHNRLQNRQAGETRYAFSTNSIYLVSKITSPKNKIRMQVYSFPIAAVKLLLKIWGLKTTNLYFYSCREELQNGSH